MSFALTPAHLDAVLAPLRSGDLPAFLGLIEPDVEWAVGASDERGKGGSGVYNVASFKAHILPQMMPVFEPGPVKADIHSVEMVGNKAIIEESITAKMKNGQEYHNKEAAMHCIVLEFSAESGRVHKLRTYSDTEAKAVALRAHGVEA